MIAPRNIRITLDWVRGVATMQQLADKHKISLSRVGQITTEVLRWAEASTQMPPELASYLIATRYIHFYRPPRRDTPESFYYAEQAYRSNETAVARAYGALIYGDELD